MRSDAPHAWALVLYVSAALGCAPEVAAARAVGDQAGGSASPAVTGAGAVASASGGSDAGTRGLVEENSGGQSSAGQGVGVAGSAGAKSHATTEPVTFRTLLSAHYLGAATDGNVAASSSGVGKAETFELIDLDAGELEDGDQVHLRAANGKFVSAASGGGGDLDAQASEASSSETFVLVRTDAAGKIGSGDRVALQTYDGAHFVSALNGGGGDVKADAPWSKEWEIFVINRLEHSAATPPAAAAKQRVLDYFTSITGKYTLSGIENKAAAKPAGHTQELAGLAGKTPAFWGVDFGFGSDAVSNRDKIVAEAQKQWNAGAVVAFMYHTCVPTRDEYCGWDDIGGAHPQHLSKEGWNQLFTPGTKLNQEWLRRLDLLAGYFQRLRAAGVAPLFRPFHEMNQCAFWWSCEKGENGSVKLWKYTHDYLVKSKGLDNIVWVWNIQDFESLSSDAVTYNPGTSYFDLASLDVYNTGYTRGNYNAIRAAAGGKPFGIGECMFLPTIDVLNSQPEWTFFMLWPDFIYEKRNTDIYRSLFATERVLTLDEMPGWK